MADTQIEDNPDDLEGEKPSTIKSAFQRWLIVAGILMTLLFIYIFVIMSNNEKAKDEAEEATREKVPEQVQDGSKESKNNAIDQFERSINDAERKTSKVGEKVKTTSINAAYAPRKTASEETSTKIREKKNKKKESEEKKEKTAYEKYIDAEQIRAYKSIAAEDTLGSDAAFYSDSSIASKPRNKTSNATPKREPIAVKQEKIRQQISAITKYREAIENGEIDASAPPPGLLNLLEGKR